MITILTIMASLAGVAVGCYALGKISGYQKSADKIERLETLLKSAKQENEHSKMVFETVYKKSYKLYEMIKNADSIADNGGKVEIPCTDLNNRLIIEKRKEE